MSEYTFLHAADLHLDTPFEGLGQVAPEVAEVLRDSSLAAWDALVAACIENRAAFLLLAGDIYDGEVRGVRAQVRFLRGLERLAAHGVRVFIAHGNHDPAGGRWSAIRQWPPGVTVFGHRVVETVSIDTGDGAPAVVHGISHASRETSENLALRFRRGSEPGVHFAVLHCNADRDPNHPVCSPCTVEDLRRADMDYWALGHIHRHKVLSAEAPWIVYAGGTQGRSLKPSEQGQKGAVLGTVASDRVADVRFLPLQHVRFVELQLDIADIADLADLLNRLEEAVAAEQGRGGTAGLVVRVVLRGRGPLHADLGSPDRITDLLKALREPAARQHPFLWWSDVVDETRPLFDRDAIRQRRDFSAELLQRADALRDDEGALARFVEKQTSILPAGAARLAVGDLHDDGRALLEEAEARALDELEEWSR